MFPSIPAEQARTQFLLSKALQMGGHQEVPNERQRAENMVQTLMAAYWASNRDMEPQRTVERADFDLYITTKYK